MNVRSAPSVDTGADMAHTASTAVVMPHAIGDSMYLMVLLRQLIQRGDRLTLVGGIIYPLRDWFPYAHFVADPEADEVDRILGQYDRVIQMFPRRISGQLPPQANLLKLVELDAFKQPNHILEALLAIGRANFGLPSSTFTDNGIQAPRHLLHRRLAKRVVIHPLASSAGKTWPAQAFIALARQLAQQGWQPCFVVPPANADIWREQAPDIELVALASLADLAELIYESGWCIGNDSGIGHLASALGLPTLSLFSRKKLAHRWRPGWGCNVVALPLPFVPFGKLKERFWKSLMPVSRVLAAFQRLQAQYATKQDGTIDR